MRDGVRVTVVVAAGSILAGAAVAWSVALSAPSKWPARVNVRAAAGRSAAPATPAARAKPTVAASATPAPRPAPPGVQVTGAPTGLKAKGGVLANAATGGLLWSRDLGTERPIGSITKVMTALVVIPAGNLDRQIQVPNAVTACES